MTALGGGPLAWLRTQRNEEVSHPRAGFGDLTTPSLSTPPEAPATPQPRLRGLPVQTRLGAGREGWGWQLAPAARSDQWPRMPLDVITFLCTHLPGPLTPAAPAGPPCGSASSACRWELLPGPYRPSRPAARSRRTHCLRSGDRICPTSVTHSNKASKGAGGKCVCAHVHVRV